MKLVYIGPNTGGVHVVGVGPVVPGEPFEGPDELAEHPDFDSADDIEPYTPDSTVESPDMEIHNWDTDGGAPAEEDS